MGLLLAFLFATMPSADAVVVVLNTSEASGQKRFAEAQAVVEADAREGKPVQQFVVAVTTDDPKLATRYLKSAKPKIKALAENKDNPLAWYLLSMETNDFVCLRKAAKGGNVQALNTLGTIAMQDALDRNDRHQISTNVLESILAKSFRSFSLAAAKQDANAFVNLGTCYLRGFGCKIDLPLAFECFRTAADMGHPAAMDYLSASYEHGLGVKKDVRRSLYWQMKARALRGDAAAEKWLKERK